MAISWGSPSLCKYFTTIFFLTGSLKIFAAVYLRICSTSSTGPFIFSHPSTSLLECQLILLKTSSTTEMGFNSYPNISRKWNWFQIFLSEMHLSQKNGSRGAFFLISSFLKGLTYSAMVNIVNGDYDDDDALSKYCQPTGVREVSVGLFWGGRIGR